MPNKTDYTVLETRIPRENLLRFNETLSAMSSSDEHMVLLLLRKCSLIIEDGKYQIPIGNEEDFHALRRKLAEVACPVVAA